MKSVFAAAACAAAFAFAAPAFAQADTSSASMFSMTVDKEAVKHVRSIEFVGAPVASAGAGRTSIQNLPFTLKVTISRTGSRTFDDWGARSGALRDVQVAFLDRQGKQTGGYDLSQCVVQGWDWKLDAASNAIAMETWTIGCGTAKRT